MAWRSSLRWRRALALICTFAGGIDGSISQAADARIGSADIVIRGGLIYDGSGGAPFAGDISIRDGRILAVGPLPAVQGRTEIEAHGLAVSPGFIDSVSVSYEFYSLDRRALSKVYQGITLEVLGEGESPAPLNARMKREIQARQYQFEVDLPWSTLRQYLDYLGTRGVGTNYAAYVGASTVRRYVMGDREGPPTPDELRQMERLAREAMHEGAVGVTMGLSWPPGSYAQRAEIVAFARIAAEFHGLLEIAPRHESDGVAAAVDEIIGVAHQTGARTEISMFKQSGRRNWMAIDTVLAAIESARAAGVRVSANMYPYTSLCTSLSTSLPPWVHAGGWEAMLARLDDPGTRARIVREMREWSGGWEQLIALADSPSGVQFTKLAKSLSRYQGKTLADVMRERGVSGEQAAVDLLRESRSEVWAVYRTMSENNLRRQMRLPWMGFASGDTAAASEGVFLDTLLHPRAYGHVARLLGHYVRDEQVLTLQEAIRRLTSLPAENLRLPDRGLLKPGYWADVVVFDPAAVRDLATFDEPHRYAAGFRHVLVNGVRVVSEGRHTGALPGAAVLARGE